MDLSLFVISCWDLFGPSWVNAFLSPALAGWVSAGDPGADAKGPGDAGTTDQSPTQALGITAPGRLAKILANMPMRAPAAPAFPEAQSSLWLAFSRRPLLDSNQRPAA